MSRLSVLLVLLTALPGHTQDAPWAFADGSRRALVRLWAPAGQSLARPARVPLAGTGQVRAWDTAAGVEVPAQRLGELVLLDPVRPLKPGEERRYYLYEAPAAGNPAVRCDATGRIDTDRYTAQLDLQHGGVLSSLQLKDGGRTVETLGDGVHWWVGRQPQVTTESFGAVKLEPVAAGPVCAAFRVRYPDLLAKGNELVTEYRFYREFIEVDHHYHLAAETPLTWLKLPVGLRAVGREPGLWSTAESKDQRMLTTGKSKWIPAPWVDVSYQGTQPFGLGVIARNAAAINGLFYMDSGKADEREWIYAEPFGWEKTVALKSDFDVQLTLVPHPAGPGRWADTAAKLEAEANRTVSGWQARGGPAIDTDGDGLPDLAEYERGTNPAAADTDGDGLPDGRDPDPLRGTPPTRELNLPDFTAAPTTQPQTKAEVKPVGGVPTLVFDGQPYGPMVITRCAEPVEYQAENRKRGIRVYFEMVGSLGYPGEQQAVFERLDKQLRSVLAQVPDAKLVLRLYTCNPPAFAKRYPDEAMAFNDGSPRHFTDWYAEKNWKEDERGYPSFASEVWRQNTARSLFEYVTHVRQADYARNVVGYFVCGGGTEEWYYWGDYDHSKYTVDYSKPMLKAFRDYLRRKYDGDVTRLRAAWGDPAADFATAMPPTPQAKSSADTGPWWDPARSQRTIDYYYVHNKAMEDSLLIFARTVKEASAGQSLFGMFHGYLQNHWLLEGGQAQLKELLASKDVDFWSGPPQYDRRGSGEHGCIRFLIRSLQAHGKLWISESDLRTSFVVPEGRNPALYGRPPDLDESLAVLQREFAHQLCEGGNGWWFPMGKDWYHHEPILDQWANFQRVGQAAMSFDRTADTDVAAVVDLDSLPAAPSFGLTPYLIDVFKVQELCRLGTPVDHWELDDLLQPTAKRYKLYLMLNCFRLPPAKRQLIDQQLRRNGATIVWMYAPGIIDPTAKDQLSLRHVEELLGFGLKATGRADSPAMRLTAAGAAEFPGFDPQRVFGMFERPKWAPDKTTGQITLQPADATPLKERYVAEGGEPLARFEDGGGTSIALRRTANATDIWIGSVMAPADLLGALAKKLGCHRFVDADEIVYANHSFLAIHTRAAGTRTFRLRRPADVVDTQTGRVLARGVTSFQDTIPAYRTRLYFVGDAAAWTKAMAEAERVVAPPG